MSKVLSEAAKWFDRINQALAAIACTFLVLITLAICAEIITRSFIDISNPWLVELSEITLLYLTFLDKSNTSKNKFLSMVNKATGNKTKITRFPARKWDTKKRLLASIDLARRLIDYKPTTLFQDGLRTNMEWFKSNWERIQEVADFPIGMSSAVRKK